MTDLLTWTMCDLASFLVKEQGNAIEARRCLPNDAFRSVSPTKFTQQKCPRQLRGAVQKNA